MQLSFCFRPTITAEAVKVDMDNACHYKLWYIYAQDKLSLTYVV